MREKAQPAPGPAPPEAPCQVVALAASAGGLNALNAVLSSLPSDFPAPVLVVQHLDPHHRSYLAEILARSVLLEVGEARGGESLVAGKVFIAPPGRHLVVRADRTLGLSDASPVQFARPSADLLFATLAEVYGRGAVVVVLTGAGRDGAEGARAVKDKGGIVIAQDEASAQHFGMPGAAIDTGSVDRVLPLSAIARALIELTRTSRLEEAGA